MAWDDRSISWIKTRTSCLGRTQTWRRKCHAWKTRLIVQRWASLTLKSKLKSTWIVSCQPMMTSNRSLRPNILKKWMNWKTAKLKNLTRWSRIWRICTNAKSITWLRGKMNRRGVSTSLKPISETRQRATKSLSLSSDLCKRLVTNNSAVSNSMWDPSKTMPYASSTFTKTTLLTWRRPNLRMSLWSKRWMCCALSTTSLRVKQDKATLTSRQSWLLARSDLETMRWLSAS